MNNSLAMVFPGQGSQALGMLSDVAEQYPLIEETFSQASGALGRDLWSLVSDGPEEDLNRTDLTQPALLTASVALWRLWHSLGGSQPALVSGHSLGEYSALVCAGALPFEDAVRLVNKRGELMQAAVPAGEGAMAAILGLDDRAIEQACESVAQGDVVSAVNYNSPGQVVIAGAAVAVDRAIEACEKAGAKRAMRLAVSVPSHCALMKPAADLLSSELGDIEIVMPSIPVVHNVSGSPAVSVDEIRLNLVEQLYQPVRWVDCVNRMREEGVTKLLEVGPGKVLSGLNKRIERSLAVSSIGDLSGLQKALGD